MVHKVLIGEIKHWMIERIAEGDEICGRYKTNLWHSVADD
jgi:hypothetical protein